jgi:predicted nucleotidyltransferase component of viral defense system
MKTSSILTPLQKKFLQFTAQSNLKDALYWTGGTALAEIYLQHRLSTDLNFFSPELLTI